VREQLVEVRVVGERQEDLASKSAREALRTAQPEGVCDRARLQLLIIGVLAQLGGAISACRRSEDPSRRRARGEAVAGGFTGSSFRPRVENGRNSCVGEDECCLLRFSESVGQTTGVAPRSTAPRRRDEALLEDRPGRKRKTGRPKVIPSPGRRRGLGRGGGGPRASLKSPV
jgi:hypothetical protein